MVVEVDRMIKATVSSATVLSTSTELIYEVIRVDFPGEYQPKIYLPLTTITGDDINE
jgi:hypothetical protein